MSDDWDFYFGRIDGAVSSIFVDLGLRADAPVEKRPWLLWVWVEMRAPRADGLSSGEEAPTLHEIEESLNSLVPPAWESDASRYTGYFMARLEPPRAFVEEAIRARAQHL